MGVGHLAWSPWGLWAPTEEGQSGVGLVAAHSWGEHQTLRLGVGVGEGFARGLAQTGEHLGVSVVEVGHQDPLDQGHQADYLKTKTESGY